MVHNDSPVDRRRAGCLLGMSQEARNYSYLLSGVTGEQHHELIAHPPRINGRGLWGCNYFYYRHRYHSLVVHSSRVYVDGEKKRWKL